MKNESQTSSKSDQQRKKKLAKQLAQFQRYQDNAIKSDCLSKTNAFIESSQLLCGHIYLREYCLLSHLITNSHDWDKKEPQSCAPNILLMCLTGMDKNTIQKQLAKLERKGLIKREYNAFGTKRYIHLNPLVEKCPELNQQRLELAKKQSNLASTFSRDLILEGLEQLQQQSEIFEKDQTDKLRNHFDHVITEQKLNPKNILDIIEMIDKGVSREELYSKVEDIQDANLIKEELDEILSARQVREREFLYATDRLQAIRELMCDQLTKSEYHLLYTILLHCPAWEFTPPIDTTRNQFLSDLTNIARNRVCDNLRSLEKKGYIKLYTRTISLEPLLKRIPALRQAQAQRYYAYTIFRYVSKWELSTAEYTRILTLLQEFIAQIPQNLRDYFNNMNEPTPPEPDSTQVILKSLKECKSKQELIALAQAILKDTGTNFLIISEDTQVPEEYSQWDTEELETYESSFNPTAPHEDEEDAVADTYAPTTEAEKALEALVQAYTRLEEQNYAQGQANTEDESASVSYHPIAEQQIKLDEGYTLLDKEQDEPSPLEQAPKAPVDSHNGIDETPHTLANGNKKANQSENDTKEPQKKSGQNHSLTTQAQTESYINDTATTTSKNNHKEETQPTNNTNQTQKNLGTNDSLTPKEQPKTHTQDNINDTSNSTFKNNHQKERQQENNTNQTQTNLGVNDSLTPKEQPETHTPDNMDDTLNSTFKDNHHTEKQTESNINQTQKNLGVSDSLTHKEQPKTNTHDNMNDTSNSTFKDNHHKERQSENNINQTQKNLGVNGSLTPREQSETNTHNNMNDTSNNTFKDNHHKERQTESNINQTQKNLGVNDFLTLIEQSEGHSNDSMMSIQNIILNDTHKELDPPTSISETEDDESIYYPIDYEPIIPSGPEPIYFATTKGQIMDNVYHTYKMKYHVTVNEIEVITDEYSIMQTQQYLITDPNHSFYEDDYRYHSPEYLSKIPPTMSIPPQPASSEFNTIMTQQSAMENEYDAILKRKQISLEDLKYPIEISQKEVCIILQQRSQKDPHPKTPKPPLSQLTSIILLKKEKEKKLFTLVNNSLNPPLKSPEKDPQPVPMELDPVHPKSAFTPMNKTMRTHLHQVNQRYFATFNARFPQVAQDFVKAIRLESTYELIQAIKKHWKTLYVDSNIMLLNQKLNYLHADNKLEDMYYYILYTLCNPRVKNPARYMTSFLVNNYEVIYKDTYNSSYNLKTLEDFLEIADVDKETSLTKLRHLIKIMDFTHLRAWFDKKHAKIIKDKVICTSKLVYNHIAGCYTSYLQSAGLTFGFPDHPPKD